jgi:hypothetical protein
LARVRRVQIALIERAAGLMRLDLPAKADQVESAVKIPARAKVRIKPLKPRESAPLPPADYYAVALTQARPELMKLDRYEKRALARRARAMRMLNRLALKGGAAI